MRKKVLLSKHTQGKLGLYIEAVRTPETAINELSDQIKKTENFSGILPMLCSEDGKIIATTGCGERGVKNAVRLIALWNACAGIPTEALEQGVVRELVDVLEIFTNAVVNLPYDLRPITISISDARAIIAKVRG